MSYLFLEDDIRFPVRLGKFILKYLTPRATSKLGSSSSFLDCCSNYGGIIIHDMRSDKYFGICF